MVAWSERRVRAQTYCTAREDCLCDPCFEQRLRLSAEQHSRHKCLWALALGIFVFAQCELEAERCGWERACCIRCGRTMPEVELVADYDGYECADNGDCWREIEARRKEAGR